MWHGQLNVAMTADHSADDDETQDLDDEFGIFATNSGRASKGYHIALEVNGESIDMQIDTAADFFYHDRIRLSRGLNLLHFRTLM